MPQIKCTDLTLGYGSQEILSRLSFEVNAGDYLCIVGENGSGKTTLMKTLLGLTKPLKGSIEFSDGVTARTIGYLPQQTDVQRDFPASVREIVLSGCLGHGGQQQRVLLARALCATEKILLLDEPVAGLDPKVTSEMYELIESLNKADGVTVIMISHDVDKALQYASHILHIGSDIFFGTKDEFLNAKKEER